MICNLHQDEFFGCGSPRSIITIIGQTKYPSCVKMISDTRIEVTKTMFSDRSYCLFYFEGTYIARVVIVKNVGLSSFVIKNKFGVGVASTREAFFDRVAGASKDFAQLLLWNKI